MGRPPATVAIDVQLVRNLLASQCAQWADLPLVKVASGWDNEMYRLGSDLTVRLPRRDIAAPNLTNEQRWLPQLADHLPIPVPVSLYSGTPACDYPYPWSVVAWVPGETAATAPLDPQATGHMARFLRVLHDLPLATDAPGNPFRGGPLAEKTDVVEDRLRQIFARNHGLGVDVGHVLTLWNRACLAPIDHAPTWIHGDLHPKNLIVDDGQVVMVIDWGDMCAGDPATDLAVAWMLFDHDSAGKFSDAYGTVSEPTRRRTDGWAIYFGAVLMLNGMADDPAFEGVGRRTLDRLGGLIL